MPSPETVKAGKLTKALDAVTKEAIRRSLDEIERVLVERFSDGAKEERAWLIEWPANNNQQPRWWNPNLGWVIDANRATRFARKVDAEDCIAGDRLRINSCITATEHAWIIPAGRAALKAEAPDE